MKGCPRRQGKRRGKGQVAQRDLRARRTAFHGDGRRALLLVRARHLALRELRDAGRDRPTLGDALERRREATLRLAQDKFGVSWQIVPSVLGEMMGDPKS